MVNYIPLHSTPRPFPLRNSTMTSTTKSSLQFLKPSNGGDTTWNALDSRLTWSPITGTCNTSQRPKSSHVGKHDGPNTSPDSTSSFVSVPENSEPNLTHSLDNGTSILKRGIATMPVSIHRTTTWYSLLSNWHRPSELLPYQSQPFVDLSSWMLKGSILTFGLNFKRIPLPKNTSITSQTPVGPLTQMVYYATSDASMSRTLAIFDYMFFNIHMIIPLQVISVRRRHFTKSNALLLDRTSRLCQRLLQVMCHLFPCQTCVPQTLWTSQATSDSREALEFHFHGFHREAPSIFQLHLHSSHC